MSDLNNPLVPEDLLTLLEQRPLRPYAAYGELIQPHLLGTLSRERAFRIIEEGFVTTSDKDKALGCWRKLPWDSEHFGFPAARLEILVSHGDYRESRQRKAALLEEILERCRSHGIRHLVTRVDAEDLSSIHALQHAGFEMIDGIQTFSRRLTEAPRGPGNDGFHLRPFEMQDLEQVLAVARSSYRYDRFHADPALATETADAVNEAWLRNSCLGTAADAVLLARAGSEVLGYVTCKIDREAKPKLGVSFGSIVMVATAEHARRRGVARAATYGALDWFHRNGVQIVEVGTQLSNIPAGRLYEECGFRLIGVSLTFRRLL